jgi:probable HAF family extracellular repeat protein
VEAIFQVCLSNTVVALGLAALAMAARAARLRPALVHGLWVLVLVKLVTPPLARVPMRDSLSRWLAAPASRGGGPAPAVVVSFKGFAWRPAEGPEPSRAPEPPKMSPAAPPSRPVSGAIGLPAPAAEAARPSGEAMAMAAWLGIALLWWGRAASRVYRFGRYLRWAEPAPREIRGPVQELTHRLGLRRAPEVLLVPAPISPMLWAIAARPRLLLPAALWGTLGEAEREALLVHELAHLRRRDHWVRLLEIAVTGLYWWHPLVWWARRSLREAEEWCCDAWVVRTLPGRARAYAGAILKTLDFLAGEPVVAPIGATGLASAGELKRRLVHILAGRAERTAGPSWPGRIGLAALAVAALAAGPSFRPPRSFRAMDLGSLGGSSVAGFRLNDRGQVAGWCTLIDPADPDRRRVVTHPFRTAPDRPIDPATDDLAVAIGAAAPSPVVQYGAYDINDRGQVVVWAQGDWSTSPYREPGLDRGFLVEADGRTVVELDTGWAPAPAAINDAGQVAGFVRRPRPPGVPRLPGMSNAPAADTDRISFRASAGRPVALARDDLAHLRDRPPRGQIDTMARDINAYGQVAGDSVLADGSTHAFRTAPDRPIDPATDDLGVIDLPGPEPGRLESHARAINDRGQVVGASGSQWPTSHHAFRTAPNRPIDPITDDLGTLGGLNSEAWGINERGDVVGEADVPPDPRRPQTHAFLHTGGGMIDLNDCVRLEPGWVLAKAMDINERGQILALARRAHDGPDPQRTYLLTPAPAPAPLLLMVLGAIVTGSGIAAERRRAMSR